MSATLANFSSTFWLIFCFIILLLIILDMKSSSHQSNRSALIMSTICVSSALLFALYLHIFIAQHFALEFLTGYIIELSLSIDNIFIFIIIFSRFNVSGDMQHRILFLGIMGAMIMRFIMIMAGIELLRHITWIMYVFGGILIYGGIRLLYKQNRPVSVKDMTQEPGTFISIIRKLIPIYKEKSESFFVRANDKIMMTENFIVLLLIEKADLIFAIDSIPAVLAVTQEPFIVFTSNIFAIIGLRSFYFMLAKMINKFTYIQYGLAIILAFIGSKMILSAQGIHIPNYLSLLFIVSALTISIVYSMYHASRLSTK